MKTQEEIEQFKIKIYKDIKESIGGDYGFFNVGFNIGYSECQEDMTDKKYTFNQITDAIAMARELNGKETYYKYSIEEILNSLNKQDNEK